MRRLPSLNGLRAFEAAARHGSFVGAAAELNVTQAAVSRMVRLLEERFGFQLFERRPNGLDLTPQGKALQPGLTSAFDAIAGIAEQVTAMRTTPVLTLGVGPSFAVRWLIPRLRGFYEQHPEIDVRLSTGGAINPFRDDWTCGILLGDGNWEGYESELLFTTDLFPVCSKAVAARLTQSIEADPRKTCCRCRIRRKMEPVARGGRGEAARQGARAELRQLRDGAAGSGGRNRRRDRLRPYVEDDMARGRLVAPFSITVPKKRAWYLVYRPFRRDDPGLAVLRAWLLESLGSKPTSA